MDNIFIKAICISERPDFPEQLDVGREYKIARNTIWTGADGESYGRVYNMKDNCVGELKLSHFKICEEG